MTDEEGNLRRQESQEAMIGNILVQELMIMANTQAGLYMLRQNIPGIFRNHERQASAPDSGELAKTIQSWLDGRAIDGESVQSHFSAVAGKARSEEHTSELQSLMRISYAVFC